MSLFKGFPDIPLVPGFHDELFQHFPAFSMHQPLGRNLRKIHLDITETKDLLTIKADLPGIEKTNVKVDLDDEKLLTISVQKDVCVKNMPAAAPNGKTAKEEHEPADEEKNEEKKEENNDEFPKHICIERHQEFASRKLRIPDNVDVASLKAKLEDGVLNITVNKMEPHKTVRQVPVE